jgi:hypothetical protein
MKQVQVHYSDVDGRFTRIFLPVLFGALAALGIWSLFHWAVQLPSATLPSVLFGLVLIPGTWILGWLALRLAVLSVRSGRGDWWLRCRARGGRSTTESCGHAAVHGLRSTRSCSSHRQHRSSMRWWPPDGIVMGYWDRPFDEAVDLMNEWLARYKTA